MPQDLPAAVCHLLCCSAAFPTMQFRNLKAQRKAMGKGVTWIQSVFAVATAFGTAVNRCFSTPDGCSVEYELPPSKPLWFSLM